MSEAALLRLELEALTENVAVVRQALVGAIEALGGESAVVADVKLAVTEACANVILHAYEEPGGPLEVELERDGDGVAIVVRDHGAGMQPRAADAAGASGLGLGLPVMAAVSSAFEVRGTPGGGTEVRIAFELERAPGPEDHDAAVLD